MDVCVLQRNARPTNTTNLNTNTDGAAVNSPSNEGTSGGGCGSGGGAGVDSDEEEPTIALSRNWRYQRQSRTWSRVVEDEYDDDDEQAMADQMLFSDTTSNSLSPRIHQQQQAANRAGNSVYDYGLLNA
jgi:hypothetical protein